MPGLLRRIARTTVIAGTATAVNRVSRRQAGRWAQQDAEQAAPQPAYQAAPAPPAPAGKTSSRIAQLKDLGELKDQGVLGKSEFEAQKARILGSLTTMSHQFMDELGATVS
ncbi:SHOCT domain-containing protein [Embleya sp. NPDC005575]|uniref:SHOCT domain-containing protein n=1 Tax=Embleya sp. NPDC005575 TaxID=3156892 RepID=UPI0033A13406